MAEMSLHNPEMASGSRSEPCRVPAMDMPLNLMEVVDLTLCNNPRTHELWANTRFYAAQVGVSKAGDYPDIKLHASGSQFKTTSTASVNQRQTGLSISYLLYDFGARTANQEAAQQLLLAATASQDSMVQTIFLNAVQYFYHVQAARAALDAALESERAAKESLAAAEARYNAGSATLADKLQAKTAYSQATLDRITANGKLMIAQGTLANTLGLDASQNVKLETANTQALPDDFEANINSLIEEARLRRPDLQAATAQLKAAQAGVEEARAVGKPSIFLNAAGDNSYIGGLNSQSSSIGINLSVPIFSGYAPTYRVHAAKEQVNVRSAQLEQLRLQVALDVWTSYQNLTTATQSLRTSADLLNSAAQAERAALGRYKAGVGSILDVLNGQSALANARQQSIQSSLAWNISRAALAQAMGNLGTGLLQNLSNASAQDTSQNTGDHMNNNVQQSIQP